MLRESVKRTDSVVAVTHSILEWGQARATRRQNADDRVIYTGARRLADGSPSPEIQSLLNSLTDKFVVAFVGTFGFYHLPTLAIDAARRLAQGNVHFVLAGSGDGGASLRAQAKGLSNVHFPGWLSDADSAELLRHAKVGICSATRPLAILPNKAAAYFRAALPVISSFDGDLRQLIDDRKVGFNHRPGDADAFTRAIASLASDNALRKEMSENSLGVYRDFFDAEANLELFASHVEMIATCRRAASSRLE
jgi:glycosyltransferase involved in cell wall biosynthesis